MSSHYHRYLKDESDFNITKRGTMTIKGITEQMTTYFCWSRRNTSVLPSDASASN